LVFLCMIKYGSVLSDIELKLENARKRSENYGVLYGKKETSDDKLKGIYALLYPTSNGTVAERDSWVRSQDAYIEAIDNKELAYAEWKAAEIYMKLAFLEAECWRTEQANNRYMDQAHR